MQADAAEPGTIGYSFTTGSSSLGYQVNRLGFFDMDSNGLGLAHDVGIWTAAGNLVTSATVSSGGTDPLVSGFRWHSVSGTPILAPNTTYVIGALYADTDPDFWWSSATMAPGFTLGSSRIIEETYYTLTFPTETYAGGVGPNAELTEVPEPFEFGLVAVLGLLGIVGYHRFAPKKL
jgi:hypothetical protein